jgi:hypothetical protein
MFHRDDRRRRLLREEGGEVPTVAARSTPAAPPPGYADTARRRHQPHVTDLVPQRLWLHLALLAAGALAIAGILAAWLLAPRVAEWPLLDLRRRDSLAAWLSAAWLGTAAPLAVLIYAVRRHRLDDYRGRYRMWLAAAPMLLLLSLEQTAALGETLQSGLRAWSGWHLLEPGGSAWPLFLCGLLGALAARLAIETRRCRVAIAGVALALGLAWASAAVGLGWWRLDGVARTVALGTGLRMSAILILLSSLALYARQVILLAEGNLVVRRKKPIAGSADLSASAAEEDKPSPKRSAAIRVVDPPQALRGPISSRTDLPATAAASHPLPAKASAPASAAATAGPQAASPAVRQAAASPGESPGHRKLTKAERKALKRQRLASAEQDDWWERG